LGGHLMNINNYEWIEEIKWLEIVLKEALKQLDEKRESSERIRKENIETQRELWKDIGSVSIENNLEQIVDFMAYINMMKKDL
jgi:DNA helicase-2/ATP-dependent DNA helicase PcrA